MFCNIASGKLPSFKVFEDDLVLVVMDKFPVIPGQVLLLSKVHHPPGFSQMSSELATVFISVAKKLAGNMISGLGCREITFVIEGLEVDHAHAKLYPVYSKKDYLRDIQKPGKQASDEILEINCHKIRKGE